MPSKLKLFHLPSVTLREVLDMLEIRDLVLLSLCSKNAFNVVKIHHTQCSTLELIMDCQEYRVRYKWGIHDGTVMETAQKADMREETFDIVKFNGHETTIVNYTYPMCRGEITTYWEDRSDGFRIIVDYIRKLLQCDIHTLWFKTDSFWALDWLKETQDVLMRGVVGQDEQITVEEYDMILKNCNTKEIRLLSHIQNQFTYTGGLEGRDLIELVDGSWFRIGHLLLINPPNLILWHTSFNSRDVNRIVKHWIDGELSNLKFLSLGIENPQFEIIIAGLEEYGVEVKPGRFHERERLFREWQNDGIKDLRRSDGSTASIELNNYKFTMTVPSNATSSQSVKSTTITYKKHNDTWRVTYEY